MTKTEKILLFIAVHLAATIGAPYYFSSAGLVTLFWPASGFAVAAVLLGGYHYAFAALFSCVLAAVLAPEKGVTQIFFTTANVLEIFIAPLLLQRFAKIDTTFDKATDYLKFVLHAGMLLPIPAAIIAASAIQLFTPTHAPFWFNAQQWWMADSLGILTLAPLLMIWRRMPSGWFARRQVIEGAAGLWCTVAASYFFLGAPGESAAAYPRAYLFFILVAWAATRFGRHATLLITTIVIAFALAWARANGKFADGRDFNYINIWLFLVTLSTVGMALATTFNERRTSMARMGELIAAYQLEEARRRQADEALRRSTVDFRRIVETAAEGIWTINNEGKTTFVNERMCQLLGYTAEEMAGRSFLSFMPEQDQQMGSERLAERNAGKGEQHESTLIRKDGKTILTLMHTSPITSADGQISGALAMVTDITERREAEAALRDSEARYRKIVDTIQDAILIHQSGIILYANPAAAKLLGFENAANLVGLNGFSFMHPDDRPMIIERAQRLIQNPTENLEPVLQRIIRHDGSQVTIESVTSTIPYAGRSALLVIAREKTGDAPG